MRSLLATLLLAGCTASPPASADSWTEVTAPTNGLQCFEYKTGVLDTVTRTVECFPGTSSTNAVSRSWNTGASPVSGYRCWFNTKGLADTKTHSSVCLPE